MDFYKGTIPIIDDSPDAVSLIHPGAGVGYGAVPRDYAVQPEAMFDDPSSMPLIDPSEYDARYDEDEERQSSLEHLYLSGPNGTPRFVNLDQNGQPYCWAYSTTQAVMLLRLLMNEPVVRLSAHAIGCKVMNFREEGGWCGLSAQFLRETGVPSVEHWKEQSMARSNDNPATWANAALHKVTEHWIDLTKKVYDQTMSLKAAATCLINRTPTPMDFSWWAHSVCGLRHVRIERGSWGWLILNSWKGWGRFGLGVIRGDKTKFMGAVALRVTGASAT